MKDLKIKIFVTAIRIILTAWLVYGVYIETGIYTAFAIGLVGLSVELQSIAIKAHLYAITLIKDHIFK